MCSFRISSAIQVRDNRGANEPLSVLKNLGIGRALRSRFLLGGEVALILHFALIEAHGPAFGRNLRKLVK